MKTYGLFYIGAPLLALSSGNSRMYRKSNVCSLSPFHGLKLQIESHPTRCQYPITNYLDVKLEDSELVEPAFNKHLGDNLTSVAKGDNLGIVKLDLELEAADSMIFKLPALLRGNRSF